MIRPKISIIGAGFVGSTLAHWAVSRDLGDITLLSRVGGEPQGKTLDLLEALPLAGIDCKVIGTNDYKDTTDSDVVVITAGVPRKPGMTRDDLLKVNAGVVKEVTEKVMKYSPNCFLIVVTNPLDAMVYLAYKVGKFLPHRIVGMAGVLDSTRMRTFIAEAAKVSVKDVQALVLGGHGDTMVPMMRYATISGIPVSQFLDKKTLDAIVARTRGGGGEIVRLLKTGSAYYAPALAVTEMMESVIKNQRRVLPCAAYLYGEYGVKDLFIGVPAVLGWKGIEKIVEVEMNAEEKKAFQNTVKHVRETVKVLSQIVKF